MQSKEKQVWTEKKKKEEGTSKAKKKRKSEQMYWKRQSRNRVSFFILRRKQLESNNLKVLQYQKSHFTILNPRGFRVCKDS